MKRWILLGLVLIYILFIDFNGFSTNWEDWVFGLEALKMKIGGIF